MAIADEAGEKSLLDESEGISSSTQNCSLEYCWSEFI
jgi:hypothetical protein